VEKFNRLTDVAWHVSNRLSTVSSKQLAARTDGRTSMLTWCCNRRAGCLGQCLHAGRSKRCSWRVENAVARHMYLGATCFVAWSFWSRLNDYRLTITLPVLAARDWQGTPVASRHEDGLKMIFQSFFRSGGKTFTNCRRHRKSDYYDRPLFVSSEISMLINSFYVF
jgi:hypothetical protein